MPLEQQKDIIHLINRKQNGVNLTVGPFGSVNRELFGVVSALKSSNFPINDIFLFAWFEPFILVLGEQDDLFFHNVPTQLLRVNI